MNNEITSIGTETLIKTALEGPHGALAIAVAGIVTVFGIYLKHMTSEPMAVDEGEEE